MMTDICQARHPLRFIPIQRTTCMTYRDYRDPNGRMLRYRVLQPVLYLELLSRFVAPVSGALYRRIAIGLMSDHSVRIG